MSLCAFCDQEATARVQVTRGRVQRTKTRGDVIRVGAEAMVCATHAERFAAERRAQLQADDDERRAANRARFSELQKRSRRIADGKP